MTCKVCSHESVKFDPFTYLSLPLPMESSVHLEVVVMRQNGSVPIKYGLTMDMEARYSNIKPKLSNLCNIPASNLILVDIVQSQFRLISNEEQKLKGLNGSCLFAYEFEPTAELNLNQMASLTLSTTSTTTTTTTATAASRPPVTQTLSDIQRGTVISKLCFHRKSLNRA